MFIIYFVVVVFAASRLCSNKFEESDAFVLLERDINRNVFIFSSVTKYSDFILQVMKYLFIYKIIIYN